MQPKNWNASIGHFAWASSLRNQSKITTLHWKLETAIDTFPKIILSVYPQKAQESEHKIKDRVFAFHEHSKKQNTS